MPAKEQPDETQRAWVSFDLPPIMTEYFRRLHKRIRRSDVIRFENNVHCTVRWGIDPRIEPYRVQAALNGRLSAAISFTGTTIFDNQDVDVLVATLDSQSLHAMWRALHLPNTTTTHPKYTPHVTIAHLRHGKGKLYQDFDLGIEPKRRFLLTILQYNQPIVGRITDRATYIGN